MECSRGGSMKRLSEDARRRQIRVALERAARHIAQRRSAEARRRYGIAIGTGPSVRRYRETGPVLVASPAVLTLDLAGFEDLMDFLGRARRNSLERGKRIAFDLRGCTRVSAEVVPLLAAEMQRMRHFRGDTAISGLSPQDPKARRILHAMGFFEMMGIHDPLADEEGDNTSVVCTIKSGVSLDGQVTKEIADSFAAELRLSDIQRERIQGALNEALENISEHAYLDKEQLAFPAESGRWWISSIASNNKAFLLACDFGATIPATIPATAKKRGESNLAALAALLRRGQQSEDENLLAAAFEDGVTRRPDEKGGRGLGKMKDLIHEFDNGQLTVWSGSAVAAFGKEMDAVETRPLKRRFDGTYVLWSIGQGASV